MLDETTTAQALDIARAVATQLGEAGLSPAKLVIAAGIVSSHIAESFSDKIPAWARPTAIALGTACTTASASVVAGSDWKTAVGYGLGAAAVGKLNHMVCFSQNGLPMLAGFVKQLMAGQPTVNNLLSTVGQVTDAPAVGTQVPAHVVVVPAKLVSVPEQTVGNVVVPAHTVTVPEQSVTVPSQVIPAPVAAPVVSPQAPSANAVPFPTPQDPKPA